MSAATVMYPSPTSGRCSTRLAGSAVGCAGAALVEGLDEELPQAAIIGMTASSAMSGVRKRIMESPSAGPGDGLKVNNGARHRYSPLEQSFITSHTTHEVTTKSGHPTRSTSAESRLTPATAIFAA